MCSSHKPKDLSFYTEIPSIIPLESNNLHRQQRANILQQSKAALKHNRQDLLQSKREYTLSSYYDDMYQDYLERERYNRERYNREVDCITCPICNIATLNIETNNVYCSNYPHCTMLITNTITPQLLLDRLICEEYNHITDCPYSVQFDIVYNNFECRSNLVMFCRSCNFSVVII